MDRRTDRQTDRYSEINSSQVAKVYKFSIVRVTVNTITCAEKFNANSCMQPNASKSTAHCYCSQNAKFRCISFSQFGWIQL